MLIKSFLLLLMLISCEMQISNFFRTKTIRFSQFKGKCPGFTASSYLKDIKLVLVNRTQHISFKVVNTKDYENDLKLELVLKRCPSKETLDLCENYQTIHVNKMCVLLRAQNKPWAGIAAQSKPPMNCPIPKGVVVVDDGTFDADAFSHFPIAGWFWKVYAKVLDSVTNELIYCIYVEAQLISQ